MPLFATVVFLQGEEADEVLYPLLRTAPGSHVIHGPTAELIDAARDFLMQWEHGEYHDLRPDAPWGTHDNVIHLPGDYVLTFHTGLWHVSLVKMLPDPARQTPITVSQMRDYLTELMDREPGSAHWPLAVSEELLAGADYGGVGFVSPDVSESDDLGSWTVYLTLNSIPEDAAGFLLDLDAAREAL